MLRMRGAIRTSVSICRMTLVRPAECHGPNRDNVRARYVWLYSKRRIWGTVWFRRSVGTPPRCYLRSRPVSWGHVVTRPYLTWGY